MADSSDTLLLLDRLQDLGFDNKAFAELHHFKARGVSTTIKAHYNYCKKPKLFQDGGTNEVVQRRLRLVLKLYKLGGLSGGSKSFFHLARAAKEEIPMPIGVT